MFCFSIFETIFYILKSIAKTNSAKQFAAKNRIVKFIVVKLVIAKFVIAKFVVAKFVVAKYRTYSLSRVQISYPGQAYFEWESLFGVNSVYAQSIFNIDYAK